MSILNSFSMGRYSLEGCEVQGIHISNFVVILVIATLVKDMMSVNIPSSGNT
jgi:hypothetical protein